MKRRLAQTFSLLLTGAMLLAFQNCGKFEAAESMRLMSSGGSYFNGPEVFAMKTWQDEFPAPVQVADCLNNKNYNLCLAYKDPISTTGQILNPDFTIRDATEAQEVVVFSYGVQAPKGGVLRNDHFFIANDVKQYPLVKPTSAVDWKHRYRGDTNHYVAQLHAFFWINRQRSYMLRRTGQWYYSGRAAPLRAHLQDTGDPEWDQNLENNAFFDITDLSINMGYSNWNHQSPADVALDLATITHEAGHGNLHIAAREASPATVQQYCPTKNGCFGALHEGVGDVHALIMFPDRPPTLGLYFANSLSGFRNIEQAKSRTADYYFNLSSGTKGEIHDMGEVYASIWYQVWKKAKEHGEERDIERLFSDHLAFLTVNDTFTTMYASIKTLAQQLFPAKASAIINDFRTEYTRMQVTLPSGS